MKEKVLLSTDIGSDIDDALSLQTILNSGINLRGIYTVNGDVVTRGYVAKHIVNLSGKKVDVAIGEAQPLGGGVLPYSYCESCYIDDKFIDEKESEVSRDMVFMKPERVGIRSNGLEHLAAKLSEGKHVVFSIAPLTNISRLILQHPKVVENIEKLYVMGCRFEDDNAHEHNIRFDVQSAQIVFGSDIPIVVVPGNLCQRYKMPVDQLEKLQSPSGIYVKRMAKGFVGATTAQTFRREKLLDWIECLAKIESDYISSYPDRFEVSVSYKKKDELLVNLDDSIHAAFDPEDYFKQYRELIEHLRNPQLNYTNGNILATAMELAIPKELSIADVYIPYCFLNPSRIESKRANVQIDDRGYSRMEKGNKHLVVTDLDFDHFKDFVLGNLR